MYLEVRMESLGLIMSLTWKKDKVEETEGGDFERPSEEERWSNEPEG